MEDDGYCKQNIGHGRAQKNAKLEKNTGIVIDLLLSTFEGIGFKGGHPHTHDHTNHQNYLKYRMKINFDSSEL